MTDRMKRFLYLCGMLAPLLFIFTTILGAAMRPGYSHMSDTISELFSPGSPNKPLLDVLHALYALLMILFGFGVLQFVRESRQSGFIGVLAAWLMMISGLMSLAMATIFPQDPWGSMATFPGQMHIILSGILSLLYMLAMILMGIWIDRSGIYPGFGIYSLITVILVIIASGFFMANQGSPIMGLTERISGLIGFVWTFLLARKMYTWKGEPGG